MVEAASLKTLLPGSFLEKIRRVYSMKVVVTAKKDHTTVESFKTQLEDSRDNFTYVFMINFRKNYKEKEQ